ncbi:uncharacterized protein LOC132167448 [Corylus avellana]|uniref:uncharacterized protein LOC132167448 n=1 Tax=Corylus avellana TaxID=13451 RepID=UPI002869F161|nr:uncharacterized protein LOC132167448 [Corylus avellana]
MRWRNQTVFPPQHLGLFQGKNLFFTLFILSDTIQLNHIPLLPGSSHSLSRVNVTMDFVRRIQLSDDQKFLMSCERCERAVTVTCSFSKRACKIGNGGGFVDLITLKCFGATPTEFYLGHSDGVCVWPWPEGEWSCVVKA